MMNATRGSAKLPTIELPGIRPDAAIARWDDDGGYYPFVLAAIALPTADHAPGLPSYQNEIGVGEIRISVVEFHCIGALPPGDHPHIYLNMSGKASIRCPYCATNYVCDAALQCPETIPAGCAYDAGPDCGSSDRPGGSTLALACPRRSLLAPLSGVAEGGFDG
jgi:uncharacterized Zn-finger protein